MTGGWGVGRDCVSHRCGMLAPPPQLPSRSSLIVFAEEERPVPMHQRRLLRYRDRPALLERHQHLSAAATAIDAQQRSLAAQFGELRHELVSLRERLWPRRPGDALRNVRRPRVGGPPPIPPPAPKAVPVSGRDLRYAALGVLVRAGTPLSLPEIHRALHLGGYRIAGQRAVKRLGDALAYECTKGRVVRVSARHLRARRALAGTAAARPGHLELGDDLGHELAGLGGVEADLDAGVAQRFHLGRRRCPCRPETMAPGVAHLLPGGAVTPAMYEMTGLVIDDLMKSAASSSAEPPISPIIITALVSGSASNALQAVDEAGAGYRVAADADAGGDADVLLLQLVERLVGERARAAHDADRAARLGDVPGGDADVGLPGADDARAVRPEQLRVGEVPPQLVEEPRLVVGGHALGDAHDERRCRPRPPRSPRPSRPARG